ncbi:MAG: putative DNA-binding domain-containing protein [Candidatus Wallbacteria bacterium]|nr:putative DNA-binding domain-containing protein [Candidatus Wallbacteria bacterium]
MAEPSLRQLQGWMQAVLTHPHCAWCGVDSDDARRHLDARAEEIVLPAARLQPVDRLAVYAQMYPLRMRDALATDYPVLKDALGAEAWKSLVDEYIRAYPSVHPNLNQLGRHLPRFLRSLRDLKSCAVLADLAELELAMTLVFDAEEPGPFDARGLATLRPADWSGAVFIAAPTLQLRAFGYPVNAYLQAVKRGESVPLPDAAPSFTVLYRKNWSVWRRELSQDEYRLLSLLVQGRCLAKAMKKVQRDAALEPDELSARLRRWSQDWIEDGYFSRIETS